jgi:predicted lipoprotein with Yx(FWY)xxD motif
MGNAVDANLETDFGNHGLVMLRFVTGLALVLAVPAFADTVAPATVKAEKNAAGVFFETAGGHTLYTYDKDAKNASSCIGECEKQWPPFLAEASDQPVGSWTIIERSGGARQWAYKGKPLYKYAKDTVAGMALGGGLQDIWHVAVELAPRPQTVVYQSTIEGRVAATIDGHTLYISKNPCVEKCLDQRLPLRAAWSANPTGDWSIIVRKDDATKQWAYLGSPVYTFKGDLLPGDLNGESNEWTPIVLHTAMPTPPWVTVRVSDYGPIFADPNGMTLYATNINMDELKRLYCDDACMVANWAPTLAKDGDAAYGNWTIVDNKHGKQWYYRGEPVFTFKYDKVPSDIKGDRFAVGNGFGGFHVLLQKSVIEETL